MNRDRVGELCLSTRIRGGRSRTAFLLGGLLVRSCSDGGHMSDGLSKGLGLLLLRNLSLLLLLLLEGVMHLALLPWLVLDPEHGRPLALVDVVVAEVAA